MCNSKILENVRQGLSCTIGVSDLCECCCDKGGGNLGECGQGKAGGCDLQNTTTKYIKGTSSCVTDNSLQPDLSVTFLLIRFVIFNLILFFIFKVL